jgi:predicted PurR-regulated permease PerM
VPDTPGIPHRRLRLSVASGVGLVVVTVLALLSVRIFVAAHRPLSWAAAAVVGAVVLDPLVDRLAPRIRRLPAVLLCFAVLGGSVVGLAYLVLRDVDAAVDRLGASAPQAAEEIEARDDQVGEVARDLRLAERVDDFVEALEERFSAGGGGQEAIRSGALTAPTYFAGAILTVFLLSYGPRLGGAALDQLPADRRAPTAAVLGGAARRANRAGLLTLADALVVGILAGAVARIIDLPAPAVLGLIAAIAAVLPHIGILLGWAPIALLTLGFQSGSLAVLVIGGGVALQLTDTFVVRRAIDRHVHVGLLVPFVVLLLAYSVYGIGAAVFALAYAIFALAVLDELAARADVEAVLAGEPLALPAAT